MGGSTCDRLDSLGTPLRPGPGGGDAMEILYPLCCGFDVHKDTLPSCLRRLTAPGQVHKEVRPFS
jgi:hypothetical protein